MCLPYQHNNDDGSCLLPAECPGFGEPGSRTLDIHQCCLGGEKEKEKTACHEER
jgi:hypothetical protein